MILKASVKNLIFIYNHKHIFKYYNSIYLISNNSCWIDCFIILYMFIYKKIVKDNIMYSNEADLDNNIYKLNEFTDIIMRN